MLSKGFRLTVLAAAALSATAAYGQSQRLKAEVGFPFRTGSAVLPAGNYTVTRMHTAGTTLFRLTEESSNASAFIAPRGQSRPSTPVAEAPYLSFRCNAAMCGLSHIATGDGSVYEAPEVKMTPAENERTTKVALRRAD